VIPDTCRLATACCSSFSLLVVSVIVMPLLARAKRQVGEQLGGDQLILADAAETKICVLLSIDEDEDGD
jgi:hypothetical protein